MNIIEWLLHDSDPSIQYQVYRDLLHKSESGLLKLQKTIETTGHAGLLLTQRRNDGHWGNGAYNPKWTCTHYVLSELTQIGIYPFQKACKESVELLLNQPIGVDGGINYARTVEYSDVCINGMILNISCYFNSPVNKIEHIIDYILKVQMKDGGWNCEYFHNATHSSLHTTISILEGLTQYLHNKYEYKIKEIKQSINRGIEFILQHELYKSSTTGEKIKDEFFKYTFPIRWKYDILRCLDYFRTANIPFDNRMNNALDIIENSKNKSGQWKAYSQPGKTFFVLDKNGAPGKWNTLRALRVLVHYRGYIIS